MSGVASQKEKKRKRMQLTGNPANVDIRDAVVAATT